jgi:hypothetical protein
MRRPQDALYSGRHELCFDLIRESATSAQTNQASSIAPRSAYPAENAELTLKSTHEGEMLGRGRDQVSPSEVGGRRRLTLQATSGRSPFESST